MKKGALLAILLCVALSVCSCTRADIIAVRGESVQGSVFPEQGKTAVVLNISSGTFHADGNCRYAAMIKQENKKTVFYNDAREALEEGYKPCSVCAKEYKD